jgi:hypothetical protein
MGEREKDDGIQSQGRKDNAATPLAEGGENASPERYPPVEKDDSVQAGGEGRSFEGEGANPQPRQGAGDGGPDPSVNQGRMGPGADPAEGKR